MFKITNTTRVLRVL